MHDIPFELRELLDAGQKLRDNVTPCRVSTCLNCRDARTWDQKLEAFLEVKLDFSTLREVEKLRNKLKVATLQRDSYKKYIDQLIHLKTEVLLYEPLPIIEIDENGKVKGDISGLKRKS